MAAWAGPRNLITVRLERIGGDRQIPDLAIGPGNLTLVREQIHSFAAKRLGTTAFTVQLWDDHGFLDLATHSAGAFRIIMSEDRANQTP